MDVIIILAHDRDEHVNIGNGDVRQNGAVGVITDTMHHGAVDDDLHITKCIVLCQRACT